MKHNELVYGGHYGASVQPDGKGVLLQLQDSMDGSQARVCLTRPEVSQLIQLLGKRRFELDDLIEDILQHPFCA